MVELTEAEVKQIQAKGDEIVAKLVRDEEFRTRLAQDPRGTLVSAGMREEAIPQFLEALRPGEDVEGYVWRPPDWPAEFPEPCKPNPFPTPYSWPKGYPPPVVPV